MTPHDGRQTQQAAANVVEVALRLADASISEEEDHINVAVLPQEHRRFFGNRARIRYTSDRATRAYHPDVEYATAGAALVNQSIQFIREQTSVVRSRPPGAEDGNGKTGLRQLMSDELRLEEVATEAAPAHLVARGLVAVTLQADDRRTFLQEVVVPLNIDDATLSAARDVLASAQPVGEVEPLPVDYSEVVATVIDRGRDQIQGSVDGREQELEALLQDAAQRLGAGKELDRYKDDLALRVELDLAYLEIVELPRVKHRGVVSGFDGAVSLRVAVVAYEGASLTTVCTSCGGPTSRVDICAGGTAHVVCLACAIRCAGCGARACRTHPTVVCTEVGCGRGFCDACSAVCATCSRSVCPEHRTLCNQCGEVACSSCVTDCAFHEGRLHRSHVSPCKDCGRLVCANESVRCRFDAPGVATICPDHAVTCVIDEHQELGCSEHIMPCAECDRLGCPDHQRSCSDCGRVGCVDHSITCAIGQEWTLKQHATQCQECSAFVCGGHARTCTVCKGIVCEAHSLTCSADGHPICVEDAKRCSECGEYTCVVHEANCVVGNHAVCTSDRCRNLCVTGGETVCRSHTTLCERGQEALCATHVARCHVGGEHLCAAHTMVCESGWQAFCSVHAGICSVCERRPTCATCVSKKLPSGGDVCRACLSAVRDVDAVGVLRRPWYERLLDRHPFVARSASQVALVSTRGPVPRVRLYRSSGELIAVRKLGRAEARSIELAIRESEDEQSPPNQEAA